MNKEYAFTLAEVLITLTIIGVIAVLTIPNLMQAWQKHERIAQIKEAYALLNHAVKLSIAENGPVNEWSDRNNWNHMLEQTYIAPYLKVAKIYKFTGRTIWKAKAPYGDISLNTGIILNNGMRISYYNDTANGVLQFIVDVNGEKGPNVEGNDVFRFAVVINDGGVTNYAKSGEITTWASRPNPGYYNTSTFPDIVNRVKQYCCNNSNCSCCARLIMLNGWKFPDDYPIEKF